MQANHANVLGTSIALGSHEDSLTTISGWAQRRESRAVFFCNVHSIATASQNPSFSAVLASGDACYPDGAPVAWMAGRIASRAQPRVSGPDVMEAYLTIAADRNESVFLFGSTPEVLALLTTRLNKRLPKLKVLSYSPPFRQLSPFEDEEVVRMINASGAGTVWVALGCPKQEQWIAEHKGRIRAVMLGVGAAFAFHAGVTPRAPAWMRKLSLEWLHRLFSDPKRLWRRYLYTNTVFVLAAQRQMLSRKKIVQTS